MESQQNLTISFPKKTLKQAKIIAAQQDTSVSAIIRELLEQYVRNNDTYEQSKERHLSILREKTDLGTKGRIGVDRNDLHE